MKNMRNYFSLISLTKYDPIGSTNSGTLDFQSSVSTIKNVYSPYPTSLANHYLYALGGKGINVIMKTVERYNI
jgi:hypothetical protein